ncbi:molybdopterin-dependent oxidoreductase [Nonomuraea sp. NN258]|nr:molybdopterin-dependent oxidoreductase [Nonomuraea antri]
MPVWAGAVTGLVAAGVALGTALLVSGFVRLEAFPVLAVGDATVDVTPAPIKDWAISTLGESDRAVLVAGVLVVLAGFAAFIGVQAGRRLAWGLAGLGLFGAIGILAVLTRPDARLTDVLPTLVGVAAGAGALTWLTRRSTRPADSTGPLVEHSAERPAVMWPGGAPAVFDRRRLLTGVTGSVVVAGASALIGREIGGRRTVDAARTRVALPAPRFPAKPLPAGADLGIKGLTPFVTSNEAFYRVHTALVVPQVDPAAWKLRIHGMVDRPIEVTYAELLKMPLTEADITLTCVSNEVGGPLVGNARWLGVRMAEMLRRSGVRADADMLLSTSSDGFTCGTPLDVVMDGRDALFAIAMNGEALPVEHGFPVRQVVPGLYGYVSATKWVVDVKVTRFDRDEAYWTPRGWAAQAPIKTQSRIDLPRAGDTIKPGRTAIAGVAWAQHTGVDAVEVRIDRGEWRQARLAQVPGPDTWRQWAFDWDATPGEHTVEVRATDAAGRTQTERRTRPTPDGASGWHTITVTVA